MVVIAFLVFYANSMIAPLVPALARGFGVHPYDLKWLIPSFSLLYGGATLIYGLLSDRFGRYPVLRILLICASATTLSLSFAMNAHQLLLLRLPSVITLKPAIRYRFKTGQRDGRRRDCFTLP
jgi:MFS family permease